MLQRLFRENHFPGFVFDDDGGHRTGAGGIENCFLVILIDRGEDSGLAIVIQTEGIGSHSGAGCGADAGGIIDFYRPAVFQFYRTMRLGFVFPLRNRVFVTIYLL